MPGVKELYRSLLELGDVELIAVHTNASRESCPEFVKQSEIPYPVAIDGEGRAIQAYGVEAFPTYVVIGRDGRLFDPDVWPVDRILDVVKRARSEGSKQLEGDNP